MDPLLIVMGMGCLVMLVTLISVLATLYQKCAPNQAMIISGFGCKNGEIDFKVVRGGGDIILPLLQRRDFISLEVMTIDIKTQTPIISQNGVPVFIEAVAQVKVRSDDASIATAAQQFLDKSVVEMASIAQETLIGHLRAVVGSLQLEDLIRNSDSLAQRIQEISIVDLKKMGLTVVSFTIKEIRDEVGYLAAMGREANKSVGAPVGQYQLCLTPDQDAIVRKAAELQNKDLQNFLRDSVLNAAKSAVEGETAAKEMV